MTEQVGDERALREQDIEWLRELAVHKRWEAMRWRETPTVITNDRLMFDAEASNRIAEAESIDRILAALRATGERDTGSVEALRQFELLKRAVNESADDCPPECNSYGHADDCPTMDPAAWLIAQQAEIESLRAAIRDFTEKYGRNGSKTGRADYSRMVPLDDIEALAALRTTPASEEHTSTVPNREES